MKQKIRTPYFEVGIKNYLYGDDVLRLAKAAETASKEFDIDVLFIAPYLELRRVAEEAPGLIVLAPYMDLLKPGRGLAEILPEAVKAAGAKGVVLNHCERPLPFSVVKSAIARANELDLLSFVCADSLEEARAMAYLHPDILNPEPTELIGSGSTSGDEYVIRSIQVVREVDEAILVEQAAGVSSAEQVARMIRLGADGTGAASGICLAPNPCDMVRKMVEQVRLAAELRPI